MEATNAPRNAPGVTGIFDAAAAGIAATRETNEPPRRTVRPDLALISSGLWMWLGFVGASVLAGGVYLTFELASPLALALLAIPAGGALAAYAWHRAYHVLDPVTAIPADMPEAAPTAEASTRASVPGIAASHPRTALAAR